MIRLLTLLLTAALALAACGGDDGSDAATAARGGPEDGAFPVTIPSKFGEVTIDAEPTRVVTLDNQATDDALALGVVPVGAAKVSFVDGGMQTWTKEELGDAPRPVLLDTDTALPYERIAALRPDVILAPHAYLLDRAAYSRLSKIAPVVHFRRGALEDSWQDTMQRVGQALGRPEQAEELVEEAESGLAEARTRTPAFAGATATIFNATPEGVYAINDADDYSMRVMADLGMRLSPKIAALRGESGRALVSAERYDLLDGDLLIGTSTSPDVLTQLERDRLFARVGAVRADRYASLPIGEATALAFPSVVSVRYATEQVVPKLERAVGAGREDGPAFPVTIEHKFGETTITSEPKRVAAVGFTEQDTVLALGVKPVAVREFLGGYDWRTRPWAQRALGGEEPAVIGREELGFEKIAAARPDLIIAINTGMSKGDYQRLSKIAPTIAQRGDVVDYGMPWEDQTRMIGRALGRSARADERIAEVKERFAQARREHPEFARGTAVLAYGGPDGYGAYASQDTRSRFLTDLGFTLPRQIDKIAGSSFYTALSAERFRLLDRDLVLMYGPQREIERHKAFGRLAAVREGRVVYLDYADHAAGAIGFSSVLSLPYLLDELVPQLAAAVDGDAATKVRQPR